MRKPILVVVSFAVLVIGLAVVVVRAAAHEGVDPNDPNVIHACRNIRDGSVRIVGSDPRRCRGNERALHWNILHEVFALFPPGMDIDMNPLLQSFEFWMNSANLVQLREWNEGSGSIHLFDSQGFPLGDAVTLTEEDGFLRIGSYTGGLLSDLGFSSDGPWLRLWGTGFDDFGSIHYNVDSDTMDFELAADGENHFPLSVGQGGLDLSGMSGDPNIGIAAARTLTINDGTNDIFALSPIVDPPGGFGLSDGPATSGYALGTNFLRLNVGPGGADVITLYTWDDQGFPGELWLNNKNGLFMSLHPNGIKFFGPNDAAIRLSDGDSLLIDDGAAEGFIFEFADGLLDMSGMSFPPQINFANGLAFTQSGSEVLSISDGVVDASNSSIKPMILNHVPDCATEVEEGGFVFYDDGADVKLVLRTGGLCFESAMTPLP